MFSRSRYTPGGSTDWSKLRAVRVSDVDGDDDSDEDSATVGDPRESRVGQRAAMMRARIMQVRGVGGVLPGGALSPDLEGLSLGGGAKGTTSWQGRSQTDPIMSASGLTQIEPITPRERPQPLSSAGSVAAQALQRSASPEQEGGGSAHKGTQPPRGGVV